MKEFTIKTTSTIVTTVEHKVAATTLAGAMRQAQASIVTGRLDFSKSPQLEEFTHDIEHLPDGEKLPPLTCPVCGNSDPDHIRYIEYTSQWRPIWFGDECIVVCSDAQDYIEDNSKQRVWECHNLIRDAIDVHRTHECLATWPVLSVQYNTLQWRKKHGQNRL